MSARVDSAAAATWLFRGDKSRPRPRDAEGRSTTRRARLRYYDDETARRERGRVRLAGAQCAMGLDYVPKRAHVFAFTVRARDDVYHLECSSEGERQRWLRTLRTAATSARDAAKEAMETEAEDAALAAATAAADAFVPAKFTTASIDALVGDAGLYHRVRWLAALNRLLAADRTLQGVNAALRGVRAGVAISRLGETVSADSLQRLAAPPRSATRIVRREGSRRRRGPRRG